MERFLRLTPDERVEMGGRARQMVEERFSDERVSEAYLAVLEEGRPLTVYWLMLGYFVAGALLIPANWQRTSNTSPFFWFGAIMSRDL